MASPAKAVRPTLLDRAIGWVSPKAGLARQVARAKMAIARRGYDAAGSSRQTWGWTVSGFSANAETYGALWALRARARDLVRNNAHAAKAIEVLVNNLVGTGIVVRAKTGDDALDKRINELWATHADELDADGRHDFFGLQRVAARAWFESGEVLLRRRRRRPSDGFAVPVQRQLLEGDLLVHWKNETLPDGGQIVEGVEFSPIGERRAYWMWTRHPGDIIPGMQTVMEQVRVPASEIEHLYEVQRPGQVRGVPWLAPVMLKFRLLDDYEEAEIVRKRTEACLAAIVTGGEQIAEQGLGTQVRDAKGNKVDQIEPGLIAYLPEGASVNFTHPTSAGGYADYKRAQLRSIAAGARMTYELISGDLSQVNFSSGRLGILEFRRMMRALQKTIFVPTVCRPIWRDFIDTAIAAGKLPDGTPYDAQWTPPRFESIDPVNDYKATLGRVRAGFMSLSEAIAMEGDDPESVLDEIQEMNAKIDERGLVLDSDPRKIGLRGDIQKADAAQAAETYQDPGDTTSDAGDTGAGAADQGQVDQGGDGAAGATVRRLVPRALTS